MFLCDRQQVSGVVRFDGSQDVAARAARAEPRLPVALAPAGGARAAPALQHARPARDALRQTVRPARRCDQGRRRAARAVRSTAASQPAGAWRRRRAAAAVLHGGHTGASCQRGGTVCHRRRRLTGAPAGAAAEQLSRACSVSHSSPR